MSYKDRSHIPKNTKRPRYVCVEAANKTLTLAYRPFHITENKITFIMYCLAASIMALAYLEFRPSYALLNGNHPYLHGITLLGFCYFSIKATLAIISKVTITINSHRVTIKKFPFSMLGVSKTFRSKDARQLYVDYRQSYFSVYYMVVMLTKGQNITDFIDSRNDDLAQFIETCIEQQLNIEDINMDGELGHAGTQHY